MRLVRGGTYDDLYARYQLALNRLADAREELAAWKGSAIRTAGRNGELLRRLEDIAERRRPPRTERLARALRACARYRAALATEARRADHLQKQLDDALGLNTASMAEGAKWQTRRDRKLRFDK